MKNIESVTLISDLQPQNKCPVRVSLVIEHHKCLSFLLEMVEDSL